LWILETDVRLALVGTDSSVIGQLIATRFLFMNVCVVATLVWRRMSVPVPVDAHL